MLENYFEKGDRALSIYEAYGRNPLVFNKVIENYKKGLKLHPKNILYHYSLGYAYHLMRRLMEASMEYEIMLKLNPPRLASDDDLKLADRYAPRLFVNPKEFFKLKDLVAVIHPKKP
ncbi:unnamed protein product, partial [marine sediment metagenome]